MRLTTRGDAARDRGSGETGGRGLLGVLSSRLGATVLLLILVSTVVPDAAGAAGTLDQQQTEHPGGVTIDGPPAAQSFAQTFTAGLSGGLDRVELFL